MASPVSVPRSFIGPGRVHEKAWKLGLAPPWSPVRSEKPSWASICWPLLLIYCTTSCAVDDARDNTPPSVLVVGDGSLAAGKVPLLIFAAFVVSVEQDGELLLKSPHAGCVLDGTPEVEIELIH